MRRNMGHIDRTLRLLVALGILIAFFTGQLTGAAAVVLGTLAVIFIVTGISSWCPLYLPFGIKTCKKCD
jgi:hypothetical protein